MGGMTKEQAIARAREHLGEGKVNSRQFDGSVWAVRLARFSSLCSVAAVLEVAAAFVGWEVVQDTPQE